MNQWRTENEPRNNRRGASWPPSRIFHGVSIQRSRIERYSRTLQETLAVENKKEWFKEKKRERDRGVAQEVVAHDSLRLSRSTFSSLGAIFGLELVLRFPEDKTMQPSQLSSVNLVEAQESSFTIDNTIDNPVTRKKNNRNLHQIGLNHQLNLLTYHERNQLDAAPSCVHGSSTIHLIQSKLDK